MSSNSVSISPFLPQNCSISINLTPQTNTSYNGKTHLHKSFGSWEFVKLDFASPNWIIRFWLLVIGMLRCKWQFTIISHSLVRAWWWWLSYPHYIKYSSVQKNRRIFRRKATNINQQTIGWSFLCTGSPRANSQAFNPCYLKANGTHVPSRIKSPCLMGILSSQGPFSIARFVYQMLTFVLQIDFSVEKIQTSKSTWHSKPLKRNDDQMTPFCFHWSKCWISS